MKDIKQSLRPCVHQDYLRRTLSSTFQFVSSNGGVLGGASNSETEQSPYSILIPLYPKLVSTTSCAFVDRTPNAHRGGHKVMAFTPTTPRRNPLGVNDQSSTLFSWEMSKGVDTDNFADNDADIEISLARYVSAPLVSDLIRGLDNADDRITSYSTQFLKAIYVSRANMMHRLDLMKQLRECTKERCLRARIFEYFRTNLCDTGHVASKQLLANDTAANESHRDHLNCLLDFVRLCVSVPISSYTFPSTNNNGQDYIGISTIESIKLLFNEFGNVILDCLQTVGSGLGMNASTADGIYCQNHLVTKIVTCLNVMMNTAVMCDQWIRRETCSFSDFSFCLIGCDSSSICRSAILLMLHRMIASWPQSACDSTCLTDVESGSKCSVHPLQFFSFDQQRKFSAQVSKRQMEGFFDSESGTYLAVRVNVSNSVREEAYVTTCYEILCSHVCSALYEAHEYVDEKTKCDQNSAIPNPFQLDNSISYCDQKFDKCVDRILFKILNGVVSDHFKISLKCISCLQERGLQILKRYFLPVPEDVWSFENGDIAQNITESCFSTPCTFKKNCLLCCRYCTKREARLDQLVSNLRLARGKHWNNRVRSSAGELLDLLLDML